MTHIMVTARRAGFRRSGRAWGTQPETVACADFEQRQIDALFAEPELIVEWVPDAGAAHEWPAADAPAAPAAPDTPAAPDVPDADRTASILDAIRGLDPDDKSNWTKGGAPQVDAIERVIGGSITAAERDAAWARMENGE